MKSALRKKRTSNVDFIDREPRSIERPWEEAASQAELSAAELRQLAHDTRNWLTALQVYCDLLRMAIVGDCERWIMELSGAIERGQKLVASLLESSQATGKTLEWPAEKFRGHSGVAHKTDPMPNPTSNPAPIPASSSRKRSSKADANSPSDTHVDLAEALHRRLPLLQRLVGTGIHVDLDASPDVGIARLSESDFDRILLNLILNAVEAMPHGGQLQIVLRRGVRRTRAHSARGARSKTEARKSGGTLAASAPSQQHSETVLLRICDSGEGISANRLPHIFEAGVSSKADRGHPSGNHGYGLANVRTLVERAGGKIRVRSRPRHGSCFEVELPRVGPALS